MALSATGLREKPAGACRSAGFGTVPVMQLRIFTEPQQGASYDDLLAVAQAAERLGFDAFFRSDHYLVMGGHDGLPGPTDAWVTLGALARETTRIRLGTLVTAASFRWPGVARDQRGPGRPDERRTGGARAGRGLVRGRTHRLRGPVPTPRRAVRAVRGAAGHHHRALDDPAGRDVLLRRPPPRRRRLAWAPQAGPDPLAHRSSSGGEARAGHPGSPPPMRPSSTWRSRPSRSSPSSGTGCGRPAKPSAVTPNR